MTRILLTGGNGFVGRVLAPMVSAAFPGERFAFTRSHAPEGWHTITGDFGDPASVTRAIVESRPDIVIHLAAQASVGAAANAAAETWGVNAGGTLALASAILAYAPSATLLLASSAEVYGRAFKSGAVDETTTAEPMNIYARSKRAAEEIASDVLPQSARLIVTRAFNHTGPNQDERFVLPSFAAQIARIEAGQQKPVLHVGKLDAARDFLDVRDVAAAYIALIAQAGALSSRSLFNISTGRAVPIRTLLDALLAMSKCPITVEIDPKRMRANDISSAIGRNDRLVAATKWQPIHTIETLLTNLLESARSAVNGA